jgi:hypothetical protein
VALSCLDYGRCTLSAGMLGGAQRAFEQATKWAQTRYQFQRPLADFQLVQAKIARMAAMNYAMDAVLYATTGMLDRHDEDMMLETAVCKVFCSEMGWRVVNDAMQIMGGESYMTENEVERIFRDSRLNLIVEGANEVMQAFIFAYGGKALAERMLGVQQAVGWQHDQSMRDNLARIFRELRRPGMAGAAASLGAELLLGLRGQAPAVGELHSSLREQGRLLGHCVREHSYQFKLASKRLGEKIVSQQCVQARLADSAMWLHAWACTLSKLNRDLGRGVASSDPAPFERDRMAAIHFMDIAAAETRQCLRALRENADASMLDAATAALACSSTLPNDAFVIPEASPVARGSGRKLRQDGIKQFPGDRIAAGVAPGSRTGRPGFQPDEVMSNTDPLNPDAVPRRAAAEVTDASEDGVPGRSEVPSDPR